MADPTEYPIPGYLSEQAQVVLAAPMRTGVEPALDDTDGWLRLAEGADAQIRHEFSQVELPVSTELTTVAGVPVYVLRSSELEVDDASPLFIDIHGGALLMAGGDVTPLVCARDAVATGMLTWAVDYRMPPLHPYPAALDDLMAVYRAALDVRSAKDIVVGGGSAGGNLAAALTLRIIAEGLPAPGLLVLLSPEVDLTESGDTFHTLAAVSTIGSMMTINRLYAAGADLADPYLSPLFGDVTGFPPTFIQSGTRDLFLSNSARMHRKLREAGVDAELHVFEAMPHGGFPGAPEDQEVYTELRRFVDKHYPR